MKYAFCKSNMPWEPPNTTYGCDLAIILFYRATFLLKHSPWVHNDHSFCDANLWGFHYFEIPKWPMKLLADVVRGLLISYLPVHMDCERIFGR